MIWAVSSTVIDLIGNENGDKREQGNDRWFQWDWSPDIGETYQQMNLVADLKPGMTESFTIEYMVGSSIDILSPGVLKLTMTSPGTSGESPADMTEEERIQYGIQTVSKEQFLMVCNDMDLTTYDGGELVEHNGDEYYLASANIELEVLEPTEHDVSSAISDGLIHNDFDEVGCMEVSPAIEVPLLSRSRIVLNQ